LDDHRAAAFAAGGGSVKRLEELPDGKVLVRHGADEPLFFGPWSQAIQLDGRLGILLMFRTWEISDGIFIPEDEVLATLSRARDPEMITLIQSVMDEIPGLRGAGALPTSERIQ
jgi:hypothetical protein